MKAFADYGPSVHSCDSQRIARPIVHTQPKVEPCGRNHLFANLPQYPCWRPVRCTDKPLIDSYCQSYMPYAEATMATMIVWNEPGECQLSQLNGNAIMRHESCDKGKVVTPLGMNRPIETALVLLGTADVAMRLVPDYYVSAVSEACWNKESLEIIHDPANDDYVFDTEQLATLDGPQFKGKRKRRNGFVREYKPRLHQLDLSSESIANEVVWCAETWFRQVEHANHPPVKEIHGLQRLLEFVVKGELGGLLGFGVRVSGELVAVSIMEIHGVGTVSGVVFKALRRLPGAAEYLRSASAEALADMGYQRINIQQDLGLPGLRQMKSSYYPSTMFKKWIIQLRHEASPC